MANHSSDTRPELTGARHEFGVEEMFFSTTDAKGVITNANDVFVRISHYSEDQLMGAPHNILRHPEMPAAAFKFMWDELEAGHKFCAYVRNRAADGATYDVFATVVPVGDSYLSVRTRPLRKDLWDVVFEQYTATLEVEEAQREGNSRHQVAVLGAEDLGARVGSLGFNGVEDLCAQLLIAEVQEHSAQASLLPDRPDATGAVGQLLHITRRIEGEVTGLISRLEEYGALVARLRAANDDVAPTVQRVRDLRDAVHTGTNKMAPAATEASPQDDRGEATSSSPEETAALQETLRHLAEVIDDRVASALTGYENLPDQLAELAGAIDEMGADIALLRLHNSMVGRLALELLDGKSTQAFTAVPLLCDALTQGADRTAARVTKARELTRAIPEILSSAIAGVDRSRRQLNKWAGITERFDNAQDVAEEREYVETQAQTGFDELNELSALGAKCTFLTMPFDADAMAANVAGIRGTLEQLK